MAVHDSRVTVTRRLMGVGVPGVKTEGGCRMTHSIYNAKGKISTPLVLRLKLINQFLERPIIHRFKFWVQYAEVYDNELVGE